jgi:hypothetical protein
MESIMDTNKSSDEYDEQEAQERFEAALVSALRTQPTPLKNKPKVRSLKKKPGKKSRAPDREAQ